MAKRRKKTAIAAAEQCFKTANAEISKGNLKKAEKLLTHAMRMDPNNFGIEELLIKLRSGAFDKTTTSADGIRKPAMPKNESKGGQDYTAEQMRIVKEFLDKSKRLRDF